jgi:hypothetical protein
MRIQCLSEYFRASLLCILSSKDIASVFAFIRTGLAAVRAVNVTQRGLKASEHVTVLTVHLEHLPNSVTIY